MIRERPFVNDVCHVLNRGVDKRKIFLDGKDYFRFIRSLHIFNNVDLMELRVSEVEPREVPHGPWIPESEQDDLLVDLLAFCLLGNHFHLLLRQRVEDGIVRFMQRIGTGYTMYFNQRRDRVGALFQGRYKMKIVRNDAHFIHLPYYIHANPLDMHMPEWRNREVTNFSDAMKFLNRYRWSSHLDYLGRKNFPSVTQREFLLSFFGGKQGYGDSMIQWLKDFDIEFLNSVIIEK